MKRCKWLVVVAVALSTSAGGTARADSLQVDVTGLDCGYAAAANTFRPTADVKRTDLQGSGGQTDQRVTVRFRLLDGASSVGTLSGAVINGDGTVTPGAAEVPVGVTRRFRPFDGVAFGDGGSGRAALLRDHAYDIRVELFDFDSSDVHNETFPCPSLPAPSSKVALRVERAGSGSGTVTGDGTALNCGATCQIDVETGQDVVLRAVPDPSSRLEAWNAEGCNDPAAPCTVRPGSDLVVRPRFGLTACDDLPVEIKGASAGLDTATLVERPTGVRGIRLSMSVRLDRMTTCAIDVDAPRSITPAAGLLPAGPGTVGFPYSVGTPSGTRSFVYALPGTNWLFGAATQPAGGLRVASAAIPVPYNPGLYNLLSPEKVSFNLFALPALEQRTVLVGSAGLSPSLLAATVPQVIVSLSIQPNDLLDDFDEFKRYVPQPVAVYAGTVQSALERVPLPPGLEVFPAFPVSRPTLGGFPIDGPAGPLVLDLANRAAKAIDGGGCKVCISDAALAKLRVLTQYSLAAAASYELYKLIRFTVTPSAAGILVQVAPRQSTPVDPPPVTPKPLTVKPLGGSTHIKRFRPLRPGKRPGAARLAGALLSLPAPKADVRGMLFAGRTGRGRTLRALFARLPRSTTTVQLVLTGPSGRYTAPLPVRDGAAGARIQLPRAMAKGTWSLGVADLSRLKLSGGKTTGTAQIRGGTFRIR